MALELARAYVQIVPSMQGVQSEINRSFGAGSGIDKAASTAGKRGGGLLSAGLVGGLAGGVAGVAAGVISRVGGVITGFVGEAVRASDATDKFKQTLKFAGIDTKTIDALTKSTQKYANETVYDLSDVQSVTAQLGANGVKNYAKVTEAAGNLNAVAGGNKETFKSVGLVLTQTAGAGKLTTENYNQLAEAIPGASGILQDALKKNGAYTGNFRDAMAAGEITAAEFNKAILQVGSKPVAVEAAKSTTTFEGAIGNLQATIVGGLTTALNSIKPTATKAISGLSVGIGAAFAGIGTVVQAIGPPIKAAFSSIGPLVSNLGPVGAQIGSAFAPLLPIIVSLTPQLLTLASSLSPVHLIFSALLPVLPQIVALVGTLATTLGGSLSAVLTAIVPVIAQLAGTLVGVGTTILSALLPVVAQLVGVLAGTFSSVLTTLLPVIVQLAQVLGAALGQALTLAAPLIATLAGVVGTLVAALAPVIVVVVQLAGQLLSALLPVFLQLVRTVLPPVLAILKALIPVITPVIKILGTVLAGVIKALLPVITAVFSAIVPIIKSALTIVMGVINVVIGLLTGNFTQVFQGLGQIVSGAFSLVVNAIKGAVGIIGAAVKAIVNIVVTVFKGAVDAVVSVGSNIVQGLINGMKANSQAVLNFISSLIGNVINFAKKLLGIASPSKVFAQIGRFVGQGLVKGLVGSQDQVKTAATSLVNQVTDAFTKLADQREAAQKRIAKLDKQLAATDTSTKSGKASAAKLRDSIREQQSILADIKAAPQGAGRKSLVAALKDDTKQLTALAGTRDRLADQLAAAQDDLASAVKIRDDFRDSIQQTSIGLGNVVDAYKAASDAGDAGAPRILSTLQDAVTQTQTFQTLLGQLRSFGVDDTTYSQVLEKGVAGGGIGAAQELVQGGPALVQQVAGLQSQLAAAGASLGTQASTVLYQAGVDTAQASVEGIKSKIIDNQAAIALLETAMAQSVKTLGINTSALTKNAGAQIVAGLSDGISGKQSDLDKVIGELGKNAVKKLKKVLGIKSPSRVVRREVGQQVGAGFVLGIQDMHAAAEQAAAGLAAVPGTAIGDAGFGDLGTAPAPITQVFSGPMGYTRDEVADGIATKARRALAGVNIQKVSVR